MIKIEYCRALHRGSKEPNRPVSVSCLPCADRPPISAFPATENPSISIFDAAFLPGTAQRVENDVTHSKQKTATFLPGTRIAPRGLRQGTASCPDLRRVCPELRSGAAPECGVVKRSRQGTAFYPELRRAAVPSLICPDEENSFRAASPARASACALYPGAANLNSEPFPTRLPGPFFATNSVCSRPFLTGSAPQTELTVTHSKQTLEKFLTGARMHIKLARRSAPSRGGGKFANSHFSAPENLLLHRRPIQIFLRPTI